MFYILKENKPVAIADTFAWAQWMEKNNTKLSLSDIREGERVVTFFLGSEKQNNKGVACFFESKVLGGLFDGWSFLYPTYNEALDGHLKVVHDVENLEKGVS